MITDPVYEGKSMQGMIDLVQKGFFPKGSKVLYAHLGGPAPAQIPRGCTRDEGSAALSLRASASSAAARSVSPTVVET
jgi:hypothetical protein